MFIKRSFKNALLYVFNNSSYQQKVRYYQLWGTIRKYYSKWRGDSPSEGHGGVKQITTLEELDKELAYVSERAKISDDELRKALASFCYIGERRVPDDPYSGAYRNAQMEIYYEISGKNNYHISHEHSEINLDHVKENPFPYYTGSPGTIGDQIIAIGYLIRTMNLSPGSSIVEFGPGWGNTTTQLLQCGYDVVAVDAEPLFLELIKHRADQLSKKVRTVHADMLEFTSDEKYDVALFYESFHHCSNHLQMLRNLYDLLNENGTIVFAAEPIIPPPYPWTPPWGVRFDGMSVWSTRVMGWLELGFDISYFLRTLQMLGWSAQRYASDVSSLTHMIIARKSNFLYEIYDMTLPPDEDETWAQAETSPMSKLRYTGARSVLTCQKDCRVREVELNLSNGAPFDIHEEITIGSSTQKLKVPAQSYNVAYTLPVHAWNGKLVFSGKTWRPDKVLKNGDNRDLGVAVHSIKLIV